MIKFGRIEDMKKILLFSLTALVVAFPLVSCVRDTRESFLRQEYDLVRERSTELQYYHMEREIVDRAEDTTRMSVETYNLRLMVEPGDRSAGNADKYTCAGFAVQTDGGSEVTIPALEGWSYDIMGDIGIDEKGQLFGIPHAKFESLTDSNGEMLEPVVAYQVYDLFIDFHTYINTFAEPVKEGKGIQDLKKIGDKIVHKSAFPESPINLVSSIAEGSTLKDGEVTLEFKGMSVVDGATCAILHVDSGEGSFTMIFSPMPNMEIKTVGSTHYWADIYLDLASKWVKKVEVTVVDVTKVTTGHQLLATAVVETSNTIKEVPKAEF